MSKPISIVLLGKFPGHVAAVREIVKPEYEVTHHFSSVDAAVSDLPDLFSSGALDLGIVGGGFSPAEFERVLEVSGAKDIPWMRPDPEGIKASLAKGGGPPSAEVVAGRLRKGLDEHVGGSGDGKGKGEVWLF